MTRARASSRVSPPSADAGANPTVNAAANATYSPLHQWLFISFHFRFKAEAIHSRPHTESAPKGQIDGLISKGWEKKAGSDQKGKVPCGTWSRGAGRCIDHDGMSGTRCRQQAGNDTVHGQRQGCRLFDLGFERGLEAQTAGIPVAGFAMVLTVGGFRTGSMNLPTRSTGRLGAQERTEHDQQNGRNEFHGPPQQLELHRPRCRSCPGNMGLPPETNKRQNPAHR